MLNREGRVVQLIIIQAKLCGDEIWTKYKILYHPSLVPVCSGSSNYLRLYQCTSYVWCQCDQALPMHQLRLVPVFSGSTNAPTMFGASVIRLY